MTSVASMTSMTSVTSMTSMTSVASITPEVITVNGQKYRKLESAPIITYNKIMRYIEHNNAENKLHSFDDMPAIIHADGTEEWYKNGKRHRDGDKPAIEDANGTKCWYKNGELHRDDKPAIEDANGVRSWYKNGKHVKSSFKRKFAELIPPTGDHKIKFAHKYTLHVSDGEIIKCEKM